MNVRLYESKLYITFNEKYLYKTIHITHKTSSVHVLEEKFSIDFYRFDKDVKKIMIKLDYPTNRFTPSYGNFAIETDKYFLSKNLNTKIRTENTTIHLESYQMDEKQKVICFDLEKIKLLDRIKQVKG